MQGLGLLAIYSEIPLELFMGNKLNYKIKSVYVKEVYYVLLETR